QPSPPADDPNRLPGIPQSPPRTNSGADAQGRSNARSGAATRTTNYDESKANPYTLPDPLVLKNGQPVKDAGAWWNQRRPEILEDLRAQMYGRIPENTPKVTWEVTATNAGAAGGTAIKKTVVGHIDNSRYPSANPRINVTLYTPSKAVAPVPLILVLVAGSRSLRPAVRSINSWASAGVTRRWKSARFKTITAAG
ncbi:MAG: acetylxylan esterase, partial [Verrucomicrobiota bacterium]